jgi:murein DD-endopeptidase
MGAPSIFHPLRRLAWAFFVAGSTHAFGKTPNKSAKSKGARSSVSRGSATSIPAAAAETAKKFIGVPYVYGGSSPQGFDCSGLVRFSFVSWGVELPHQTRDMRKVTRVVPAKNLRKGDLLFFNEEGKKSSHVALYLGNGQFVHAPSTGGQVRVDELKSRYWSKSLSEIRRVDIPARRSIASDPNP